MYWWQQVKTLKAEGVSIKKIARILKISKNTVWQKSIDQVKEEIYELKKQLHTTQQQTNEERIKNLSNFFDNVTSTTDNPQRNDLYKTIIESIIYQRDGENISVNIVFR